MKVKNKKVNRGDHQSQARTGCEHTAPAEGHQVAAELTKVTADADAKEADVASLSEETLMTRKLAQITEEMKAISERVPERLKGGLAKISRLRNFATAGDLARCTR